MTTNVYDMTDTWNNGGTAFTAIKSTITDTASDAESLLLNLVLGSTSKFKVRKDGKTTITGPGAAGSETLRIAPGSGSSFISLNDNGTMVIDADVSTGSVPLSIKYNGSTVMSLSYLGALGVSGSVNIASGQSVLASGYLEMVERSAPGSAGANTVRIYSEDNGSGKTRLMAIFGSGAAQQIAIEP